MSIRSIEEEFSRQFLGVATEGSALNMLNNEGTVHSSTTHTHTYLYIHAHILTPMNCENCISLHKNILLLQLLLTECKNVGKACGPDDKSMQGSELCPFFGIW